MSDFLERVDFYICAYDWESKLFKMGNESFKRGWLEKNEFMNICLWKSRRPKKYYQQNTNEAIKEQTKLAFSEVDEEIKIGHLIKLRGVSIPTASAILSITNPKDYPIIDERCIQSLRALKIINLGNITTKSWLIYLSIIRNIANEYGKSAREIEKGLFAYNRIQLDEELKNLYK